MTEHIGVSFGYETLLVEAKDAETAVRQAYEHYGKLSEPVIIMTHGLPIAAMESGDAFFCAIDADEILEAYPEYANSPLMEEILAFRDNMQSNEDPGGGKRQRNK